MENASKALIIAGAILLSILLISLGIMIFNQATSVVDGSGMTQAEVQSFNSKFSKYEDTVNGIKGSVVKAMINEVNANNNDATMKNYQITINGSSVGVGKGKTTSNTATNTTAEKYTSSGISSNQLYNVEMSGFGSDGRITEITITEHK